MRKLVKKRTTFKTLFFCAVLCLSSIVQVFSQSEEKYVTPEIMQTYAESIINTYIDLSKEYFPSNPNNLTFYEKSSYSIDYYTSSQGGVAIWIKPSTKSDFKTITTDDKIETAVFGGNYSLNPMFNVIGKETMAAYFQTVIDDGRPFIKLLNEYSGMIVHKILINRTASSQEYYLVVIKASNQTKYWTLDLAYSEALDMLKGDFGFAFANSEELAKLITIPAITEVIKHIQDNLKNESYTEIEYLEDLEKIKELATQNEITTTILNELRGFVIAKNTGIIPIFPDDFLIPENVTESFTTKKIFIFTVSDPQNFLYMFVLIVSLVIGFTLALFAVYYKSTKKRIERKFLLTIPVGFLIWFISDTLYLRPDDLTTIQLVIIIIFSFIGVTLVYWKRQLLRSFAFRTKNKK